MTFRLASSACSACRATNMSLGAVSCYSSNTWSEVENFTAGFSRLIVVLTICVAGFVAQVQDRLRFTLQHLRQEYFYCFWCGAQYVDQKEMDELCPGESEEAHD